VDKAPRDFPNDLLNQIENLEFTIHELGKHVLADRAYAPVIVITSNSERPLPEPFLRRCVYHHIEFPTDRAELDHLLGGRLRHMNLQGQAFDGLVQWFFKLREDPQTSKKPSTSELLDWLRVLSEAGLDPSRSINLQRPTLLACLGSLLKTQQDIERVGHQVRDQSKPLI